MSEQDDLEGSTRVMKLEDLRAGGMDAGPHAILLMVADHQIFRLPLSKEVTVLGRAAEADLKLDFPDVSRKHCKISRVGPQRYQIEDVGSSGGTYVHADGLQEARLDKPMALSQHDIIRIGAHKFSFIIPSEVKPGEYPQLIPDAGGPTIQLSGAVCTVGRVNADVTVADPRVSSKHAVIETFAKDCVYLIDQGSANGTTVNGKKVTEPHRLEEHDQMAFAGIGYRISMSGLEAKTMIGVVAAPGKDRAVVGSGTLRFDDLKRVVEASGDNINVSNTLTLTHETTGVGPKPTGPIEEERIRSTTGTFTGPHPLAKAKSKPAPEVVPDEAPEPAPIEDDGPVWLANIKRRLREPGGTLALRIVGGVVLLMLLLFPYTLTVSGECRLVPGAVQKSRAAMGGRVEKVLVSEGQRVKKGDVLLRFAERDLQYDMQKAKNAKVAADAALSKASVKELKTNGDALKGALERADREVERVQALLDLAIVRASIDGKVVTASPQDLTNSVVSIGQELIEIDDTGRVIAEVLVPESDIGDVAVGQSVFARVYTDTTETYESKVQTIMPVAEKGVLGSVVIVKAPIQNDDERLIPGTTGVAKIVGRRHMGIVLLFKKIARIFK